MKRIPLLLAMLLCAGTVPGCILVGAAVVAGAVYTTGDDSAALRAEIDRETAFAAARSYVDEKGLLDMADPNAGRIEARVWESDVTIDVTEAENDRTVIEVTARRHIGLSPDQDVAKTIAEGIALRLRK